MNKKHLIVNKRRIINILVMTFILIPSIYLLQNVKYQKQLELNQLESDYKKLIESSYQVEESNYKYNDNILYIKSESIEDFLKKDHNQPIIHFKDGNYVEANSEMYTYREVDNKIYLLKREDVEKLPYHKMKLSNELTIASTESISILIMILCLLVLYTSIFPLILYYVFPLQYSKWRELYVISYYEGDYNCKNSES